MTKTSLAQVIQVLGQPLPPPQISQHPHDYDPGHYQRLCCLGGAAPDLSDLSSYIDDMCFMPLQPDLLRYLLPMCLKLWQEDLFSDGKAEGSGVVQSFWFALSPRLTQNTFLLEEELNTEEYQSVMHFMRDTLLERMSQETELHFIGSNSHPYQWFHALGSFSIVFPNLSSLWNEWWQMSILGHLVCVLQYASCLMYPDNENPVFAAWTPEKGGGPPELWENENLVSDFGWRQENIAFLAQILTPSFVEEKLKVAAALCAQRSAGLPQQIQAQQIQADWPKYRDVVAARTTELPRLLALSSLASSTWSV